MVDFVLPTPSSKGLIFHTSDIPIEFVPTSNILMQLNLPSEATRSDGEAVTRPISVAYYDLNGARQALHFKFTPIVAAQGEPPTNTWALELHSSSDPDQRIAVYTLRFHDADEAPSLAGTLIDVQRGWPGYERPYPEFDGNIRIKLDGVPLSIDITDQNWTQRGEYFQPIHVEKDGVPNSPNLTHAIMMDSLEWHKVIGDGRDYLDFSGTGHAIQAYMEHSVVRGEGATLRFENMGWQMVGSEFSDRIVGSDASDAFRANGGDDILKGRGGYDHLSGGAGNDTLNGGAGRDWLWGDLGDDLVFGGRGNDWIFSDSGDDQIHGNRGDDTLSAGPGNDVLQGGLGEDQIDGGAGDDTLVGGRLGKEMDGARDVFVFKSQDADQTDIVLGFEDGMDQLYVEDLFAADFPWDFADYRWDVSVVSSQNTEQSDTVSGSDRSTDLFPVSDLIEDRFFVVNPLIDERVVLEDRFADFEQDQARQFQETVLDRTFAYSDGIELRLDSGVIWLEGMTLDQLDLSDFAQSQW